MPITRQQSKIFDVTESLAITLLMFNILNSHDGNDPQYLKFAMDLGWYWNERAGYNKEDFPGIR